MYAEAAPCGKGRMWVGIVLRCVLNPTPFSIVYDVSLPHGKFVNGEDQGNVQSIGQGQSQLASTSIPYPSLRLTMKITKSDTQHSQLAIPVPRCDSR